MFFNLQVCFIVQKISSNGKSVVKKDDSNNTTKGIWDRSASLIALFKHTGRGKKSLICPIRLEGFYYLDEAISWDKTLKALTSKQINNALSISRESGKSVKSGTHVLLRS